MNLILIGILFYIVLQLFLGFYISKFIKSTDDYLLGGRKLGYFLATFSIFATWFGAESCIGTAGAAYESGLSGVTADPFGYGVLILIVGLFFAIPLYKLKLTTIADFFSIRYSEKTAKIIAALMIPTSIFWAAAQIRAFGLILSSSSTLTVNISILISAIIVITYTTFGGLLADAYTDLIQGFVLIIGLFLLFVFISFDGIQWQNTLNDIAKEKLNISVLNGGFNFYELMKTIEAWAVPICGSLIAQELISRVISAKSAKVAKRSSLLAGSLYICIGLIPLTLGLIGYVIIPNLENPEQILPFMAQKYFTPILYVIFAGALISAILSTVDSTLLASSALMSHNLIFPFINIKNEKSKILIIRLTVILSGITAYFLAVYAEGVYNLVKDASAFGSSGIFIAFIFGIIGKFGDSASAISAVITGSIVWFVTYYFIELDISYSLSLVAAMIIFILVAFRQNILNYSGIKTQ